MARSKNKSTGKTNDSAKQSAAADEQKEDLGRKDYEKEQIGRAHV